MIEFVLVAKHRIPPEGSVEWEMVHQIYPFLLEPAKGSPSRHNSGG